MSELFKNADSQRKVAIYIRVSTAEQKIDGYSLEAQRKKLISYVEANKTAGYITKNEWIFTDTHTGSDLNREALLKLRKMVREKKFDAVLVWKIDRLSRSLKHLLTIFEEFEQNEVSFISVQENIDFKGPIGKLIFQIFGAIAQFERELIKGRTLMGKIASAELGNFTGSQIPYGYKPVANKNGKGKKLQIIPEEKAWVEKIFEWYVYEDMGFGEVATKLNKLKVPKGEHMKIKVANFKWTDDMVSKIVKNTLYKGEYVANRKEDNGNFLPEDQWTVVSIPACVSEYIFIQAQSVRGKRKAANATQRIYVLAGKMKDKTFDPPRSFVGCKRHKGGLSYRRKQFTDSSGVYHSVFELPALQIEEYVIDKIKHALKDPEVFIEEYLSKQYSDKTRVQKLEEELDNYKENKINQEIALARIEQAYENGTYSEEQLSEKSARLNKQIAEVENSIQVNEDELRIIGSVDVEVEKLREASKQVKYKLENLSRKQQKILVDLFVDRIEMYKTKEGRKSKIYADIHFRFNPNKFNGPSQKGWTRKDHSEEDNNPSFLQKMFNGATDGNQTRDLILTMDALYQLSYCGVCGLILCNFVAW